MLKFELTGVTVELAESEGDVKISSHPVMVEVIGDLISRQYGVRGHLVGGLWMSQADLAYIMTSKDLQQYNPRSPLEKGARTGETKTINGKTYVLNENSRWVRQKDEQPPSVKASGQPQTEPDPKDVQQNIQAQQSKEIAEEEERKRKAEIFRARAEAMKNPRSYIDRGNSRMTTVSNLLARTEVNELQTEKDRLAQEFDAILDKLDDFTEAYKTPTGQRLLEVQAEITRQKRESDIARVAAMETLRQQIINKPDIDTSKVSVTRTAAKELKVDEIHAVIDEFAKITGGLGLSRIKKVTYLEDRAYADREGTINIGVNDTPERAKAVLFHEMAHFIEHENPMIAQAAYRWIKSRATGEQTLLKEIEPDEAYDDDETAYPGQFVNAYVGKVYNEGQSSLATEVLAVGMEHFTDAKSMLDLYDRDPEHFAFMLGVFNHG